MSFLRNVSWVGSGTIISIGISIVSVPIILKQYSTVDVSHFLFLWTIVGIVNLSDCGVSRGVSRFVSGGKDVISILKHGYAYLFFVFSMLIFVYLLFSRLYGGEYLNAMPDFVRLLAISIVLISFITFPLSGYIEGVGGFKESSIAKNICNMITYGMPVLLAAHQMNIAYVLCFSVLLSRFTLLIILLYLTVKSNRYSKKKNPIKLTSALTAKDFYSYCFSIGVASLLGIAFLYWDRLLALNCFSGSVLVHYVAFSEIVIKSYAIPGVLAGVIFQYFSAGSFKNIHTKLVKYLNIKVYISLSILTSTLFVCFMYFFNDVIFSKLIQTEISNRLKLIFYIVSFFTALNCFTMIVMTIGQALGNHKKILTIQIITLPIFSLISFSLIKFQFIEIGFFVWFMRIPTMLVSILYLNDKKLGET